MTLKEYLAETKKSDCGRGLPEVRNYRGLLPMGEQELELAPDAGQNGMFEVGEFGTRKVKITIVPFATDAIKIMNQGRTYYAK